MKTKLVNESINKPLNEDISKEDKEYIELLITHIKKSIPHLNVDYNSTSGVVNIGLREVFSVMGFETITAITAFLTGVYIGIKEK